MMKIASKEVRPGQVVHYKIEESDAFLSYSDVIGRWRKDQTFRSFFNQVLAAAPFPAFRWETPCLTTNNQQRDFEFVLLNAERFAGRRTDTKTFKQKFSDDDVNFGVVNFSNISGDATMVVPSPRTEKDAYGHLAAFVREAPEQQVDALWRVVGDVVQMNLCDKPVWLNTAGGGVAWLHVRLDSRPKYYGYAPFKSKN